MDLQCFSLYCTLHNLSYILCLSFEFAFAIQLFCIRHSTLIYAHSSFRFRHSTSHKQQSSFRIRPSSSVECTFIFSHPTFSICPLSFRFRHQILGIVLASFRIRHSTFRIWLLPAGQRPIEIVDTIDLNHPLLKWWSRVGRETSQWSRLRRSSPLPKNQTSTTDRTKREWSSFSLDRTEPPFRSKKL